MGLGSWAYVLWACKNFIMAFGLYRGFMRAYLLVCGTAGRWRLAAVTGQIYKVLQGHALQGDKVYKVLWLYLRSCRLCKALGNYRARYFKVFQVSVRNGLYCWRLFEGRGSST